MVEPSLEDGFTQIENEVLEALAGVNLGAHETRVLFYVIRKTYGWKKKTDWISQSQFSKGLSLDRRHVFQALKRLEKKGLVVICRYDKKHPTYGFNKDYSKWKMSDFHKSSVSSLNLKRKLKKKEREEKREREEKAHVDMTPLSYDGAYTKETLTKETVKEEREEREERDARERGENQTQVKTPFLSKKEEQTKNPNQNKKALLKDENLQGISFCLDTFERFNAKLSNSGYSFTENKAKMIFNSVCRRAIKNNSIEDGDIEDLLLKFAGLA